jgi:hypothetical protein
VRYRTPPPVGNLRARPGAHLPVLRGPRPRPDRHGPRLLLPKHVAAAVLAGTVTRARLPEGRWTPKARDHVRIARRRRRDDDGHPTGPVRAGRPIAPLRILAQAHVRALDDIGEDDAREMGYDTVRHLVDELASTYRVAITDSPGYDVRFEIDRRRLDVVRLLPRQNGARALSGAGDEADVGQYTTSSARALTGEPEAVDPRTVERGRTALECRQRYVREKLAEESRLARMTLGERIDRELAAAQQAGEDTTRYVRSIEQRLAALERRVRGGGNA